MSEGMSAERIAELGAFSPTRDEMHEALAEVERLRARETLLNHRNAENAQTAAEIDRDRDQLRARLDEIGETREEWSLVWPDGNRDDYGTGETPARVAREGTRARLEHRLAGEWREVPHA